MKYFAYTHSKDSKALQLQRILSGKPFDQTVYVIGVEDHVALVSLLSEGQMNPGEMDGVKDIVTLAKSVQFVEAIGRPDGVVTEAKLLVLAQQRIKQLEAS